MLDSWKESYDKPRHCIKNQTHHFVDKGLSSWTMAFPVVLYGCETWTVKKAEHQRIDAFELCWRRLLRVPWTARRSNQLMWREINPEYLLEGQMLKLQYSGYLMPRANSSEKTLMLGKIEGRRRREQTEDEMVGWHHWLNGHESEHTLGDNKGERSLVCYSSQGISVLSFVFFFKFQSFWWVCHDLNVVLVCISLMIDETEHSFICLVFIWIFSYVKFLTYGTWSKFLDFFFLLYHLILKYWSVGIICTIWLWVLCYIHVLRRPSIFQCTLYWLNSVFWWMLPILILSIVILHRNLKILGTQNYTFYDLWILYIV